MNELRKAYQWVPGMYIMQGLPFALITIVAPILYKDFAFNNVQIAFYTSLLTLPWVFKFLLAPALEGFSKRNIVLLVQVSMILFVLLLALSFSLVDWYYPAGVIFVMIAIMGAIYDINSDGLYLESLSFRAQASLIGIRTLFYQLGRLLCRCVLIFVVGYFSATLGKEHIWSLAFFGLALIMLLLTLHQLTYLPKKLERKHVENPYQNIIKEFMQLPFLTSAIIFVLLYEFPEAQLIKIVPLYMMDSANQQGLGLSVENVGIIFGGIGMFSMLLGVTLSGYLLNRFSLKKCLIPFTVFSTLGYMSYLTLNYYHSYGNIIFCIAFAEFGFGLGNGAYMLYLIQLFAKGSHSMSLYAIGTAIMLLGVMLAGAVSGYLQYGLGYHGFFIWVTVMSFGVIGIAIYNVKRVLP